MPTGCFAIVAQTKSRNSSFARKTAVVRAIRAVSSNTQFEETLSKVWDEQVAKGIASQQLAQFAIASVIASAVRPASTVREDEHFGPRPEFVTEKENRVRKQLAENQYVGIGIKVGIKDGYPQILEPFYGGSAMARGGEGDLIVAVNGVPSKGRVFGDIIEDLRGEKGSTLTVTLRHESEKVDREYTMIRNVIPIAHGNGSQKKRRWLMGAGLPGHPDIAYLKITDIVGSTAAELAELARKTQKQNFRGVLLDLRRTQVVASRTFTTRSCWPIRCWAKRPSAISTPKTTPQKSVHKPTMFLQTCRL